MSGKTVEKKDLVPFPEWMNAGFTGVGSGPLISGFLSVTHRKKTNVKPRLFIR
jgi:hypothetical protein